jgi:hypothetical protein
VLINFSRYTQLLRHIDQVRRYLTPPEFAAEKQGDSRTLAWVKQELYSTLSYIPWEQSEARLAEPAKEEELAEKEEFAEESELAEEEDWMTVSDEVISFDAVSLDSRPWLSRQSQSSISAMYPHRNYSSGPSLRQRYQGTSSGASSSMRSKVSQIS